MERDKQGCENIRKYGYQVNCLLNLNDMLMEQPMCPLKMTENVSKLVNIINQRKK